MRTNKLTQSDLIEEFLSGVKGAVATLKELYENLPNIPQPSIRRIVRKDSRYKNIARGVYTLTKGDVTGLLIQGDGRKLTAIEDNSINLIFSDHPWPGLHKGGNRNFKEGYEETEFKYTQDDFYQKARVLQEGGYLVELLPTESEDNYEYLYQLKQMAKKAGFRYYAKIMWQKSPGNTGRTVKEFEDILIFSKGKAKRINDKKTLPYATREMLKQRLPFPIAKKKSAKNHDAEKPQALFEYLVDMLSNKGDIVLDVFAGAANTIPACLNKSRFVIAYELLNKYVTAAAKRFGMSVLYEENVSPCQSSSEIETVPAYTSTPSSSPDLFQLLDDFVSEQEYPIANETTTSSIDFSGASQLCLL